MTKLIKRVYLGKEIQIQEDMNPVLDILLIIAEELHRIADAGEKMTELMGRG